MPTSPPRSPLALWTIAAALALAASLDPCAAAITGRLETPGVVHRYQLHLDRPERCYFDSRSNDPALRWSLTGPRGALVSNRTFTASDATSASDAQIILDLVPGDYAVIIDAAGDATPTYAFDWILLASSPILTLNTPTVANLSPANRSLAWQFTAASGDFVQLASLGTTNVTAASVRIVNPQGNVILNRSFLNAGIAQLVGAGTYTLLLEGRIDNPGDGSLGLALNLLSNVPPVLPLGAPLDLGSWINTNLAANTTNVHRFSLAQPSLLFFDSITPRADIRWSLRGPYGSVVGDRPFRDSDGDRADPELGLDAGEYALAVAGSSGASGAYSFRLLDSAAAPLTPLDTPASFTLDPPTATTLLRFSAPAGARLFFDSLSGTSGGNWRLVDPFNTELFSTPLTTDQGPITLPTSGFYSLALDAGIFATQTGTASLAIRTVTDGTQALTLGSILQGAITQPGQFQRYTFNLASPANLYFDSLTNRFDVRWSLAGPGGAFVAERAFRDSDGNRGDALLRLPAGDFTLAVHATGDTTAGFAFRLLDLATATPVALDAPIAGTLTVPNETRLLKFTASAGTRVFLNATGSSSGNGTWQLLDPYLNPLASANLTSDLGPVTLSQPGTYQLWLEGYITDTAPVAYGFQIHTLVDGSQPLTIGSTLAGSIDSPGQAQRYHLNLTQPADLCLDCLTSPSTFSWTLAGLTGAVASGNLRTADANYGLTLLHLAAGNYTMTVTATGDATGSFSFRWLDLSAGATLALDTPIAINLEPGNSTAVYRFDLPAPNRCYANVTAPVAPSGTWRLLDPSLEEIQTQPLNGDQPAFNLTAPGTYTLLFEGNINNTSPQSLGFELVTVNDGLHPLPLDSTVTGSIARPGQVQRYTLTFASPHRLYFDALSATVPTSWSLSGPAGPVVPARDFSISDASGGFTLLDLPTGNYTLAVFASADATGAFSFRLLDAANATLVPIDLAIAGTLIPPAATALYRFDATAGDRWLFDSIGGARTYTRWRAVDPVGRILFASGFAADHPDILAQMSGAHLLCIEGGFPDTESANFSFKIVPQGNVPLDPIAGTSILLATAIAGSCASPAATNFYRFSLAAETRLAFDVLARAGSFYWWLRGPQGFITQTAFSSSDYATSPFPHWTLPPGDYELRIGGDTGNYAFRLLDLDSGPTFTPGTPVTGSASPARSIALHRFNVAAGQSFYYVGSASTGYQIAPRAVVLDPLGNEQLALNADSSQSFTTPVAGTCVLLVTGRHDDEATTGSYGFTIVPILPETHTLALGATVEGAIAGPGQSQTYTFSLPQPTRLCLDALTNADVYLTLTGPLGTVQARTPFTSLDYSSAPAYLECPAGDYTLRIDAYGTTTTAYRFRVLDTTTAQSIALDTTITVTNQPAAAITLLQFNAQAGDRLFHDFLARSGSSYRPWGQWITPSGFPLLKYFADLDSDLPVAPESGPYLLAISGRSHETADSSSLSFRLLTVSDSTHTLTLGTTVTAAIDSPRSRHIYNFSLPAPARLFFDALANPAAHWSLEGPSGALVSNRRFDASDTAASVPWLDVPSGNFTLTVGLDGDAIGPFAFRLLDLDSAQVITPNLPVAGQVTPATATAAFRLDGQPGDQIFFDWQNRSGYGENPYIALTSPRGLQVFRFSIPQDAAPFTLTESGPYAFLVMGRLTDTAPTGSFSFTVRTVPTSPIFALLPETNTPDLVVSNITLDFSPPLLTGQTLTAHWQIVNAGPAPVERSFTDRLTVRHATTGALLVNQLLFYDVAAQGPVPPGAALSRSLPVTLPNGPTAAGPVDITLTTDTLNNLAEQNLEGTGEANNSTTTSTTVTVAPYPDLFPLNLSVNPPPPWPPGTQLTLTWSVTNLGPSTASGPWRNAITVRNLTTQRILLNTVTNDPIGLLDPGTAQTRQVQIPLPASADAYGQIQFTVTVDSQDDVFEFRPDTDAELNNASTLPLFNEAPALTLTLATNRLQEGQLAQATLTRRPITADPLTVQIQSNDNAQLAGPGPVTIPAGLAEATFLLRAVDDTYIERERTFTVTASASGYGQSTAQIAVTDNDLPSVTLSLAANTVSENAGPTATSATLTRSPTSDRPVTVLLTSANPAVARVPASVTIPASQTSASFPVAAIDNTLLDGPRTVALGGSIPDAFSGQIVAEIPPVLLTVTDDDGATLSLRLAATVVPEGRDPATTATVSRNDASTLPLNITLTSSNTREATVPPTVTLPSGQSSIAFPIASIADGVTDGSQPVTLIAAAPGYTPGTAVLTVSDADLPDLVVSRITFNPSGLTEGTLPVTLRVENRGFLAVSNTFTQRLFLSTDRLPGNDTLAAQVAFQGTLPPAQFLDQTVNVHLPSSAGSFWLIAQADATTTIPELLEDNNFLVSTQPVTVQPGYLASVETDVTAQPTGLTVPLRGTATRTDSSLPAPFVPVTLHLEVRGVHRTLDVLTDASGHFETVFNPLPNEAGHYRIAASYPGQPMPAPQDEFSILGFTVQPFPILDILEGTSLTATSRVQNLSDIPLTGLAVNIVTNHPGLTVSAALATNRLDPDAAINLVITVTPIDRALLRSTVYLEISAAEGPNSLFGVGVQQRLLRAQLAADPARVASPMLRGRQTPLSFQLTNLGGIPTGPIDILTPPLPWLAIATPLPLDSLDPGATSTITLLLTPPSDLPLGNYSGTLSVSSPNASLSLPFLFQAISDAHGDLLVSAEDEYTYFAAGNPPLANAQVVLSNPLTGTPVATNITATDGTAFFPNLTEAYYFVDVTAHNHNPFRQTVLVAAGTRTNLTAFLPRHTVTYSFSVVPTDLQDEYALEIEQIFETQIPIPVVTLDPAVLDLSQYPQNEFQIDLTIRNQGLIAAEHAALTIPTHPAIEITPLVQDIGQIPALSSITIPVLFKRLVPYNPGAAATLAGPSPTPQSTGLPCTIDAGMTWDYACGPNSIGNRRDWLVGHITQGCDVFDIIDQVFERVPLPPPPYLTIDPWWTQQMAQLTPFSNFAPPPLFRLRCRPNRPTLAATRITQIRPASPPTEVCARVSLKLDQSTVLTRDAFKATLEIDNPTPNPVQDILVTLAIQRADNSDATSLFGIRPPALTGFSAVDGTGSVQPQSTGQATWTLIPSLDAAPTDGALTYLVGGTLSYSHNGDQVTVPLTPAPINVHPQPELDIRYFHERSVYADDPFTPEIEPAIPYSLAVQVRNVGYGAARSLKLLGAKPEIVENVKGLLVEFKTLGTQIENRPVQPALDLDLGQIDPGTNTLARWLFSSSIQGTFTNFSATFRQTDPLGTPRLSLIRNVEIHELIHIVNADRTLDDHRPDMLVSDDRDPNHIPDTLYLSDGTTQPVHAILNGGFSGTPAPDQLQITLTATTQPGWSYFRLPNPAGTNAFALDRVLRPDGSSLAPGTNAWTTDRTLRGGALRPVYTNELHILDLDSPGTYTLVFTPVAQPTPDTTPPTSSVATLPAQTAPTFDVRWSGSDNTGIVAFDIFVAIDNTPALRWLDRTPLRGALFSGQLGHSYAFYSVAYDAAGNTEPAPTNPDTQTTVAYLNTPPTLDLGSDRTFNEGTVLTLTPSWTDPDPGQSHTFTLLAAPVGVLLNPQTGTLTWITGEADGPSTNRLTLAITDSGNPPLSATHTVTLVVRESNRAPELDPIPNARLTEGDLLTFACRTTDYDLPGQTLRFSLAQGAPPTATIDPVSGQFRWTPGFRDGPATNHISVRVTDNGTPPLASIRTFTAIVRDTGAEATVYAGHTNVLAGADSTLPLTLQADTDVTEITFVLRAPANRFANLALETLAPDVLSASIVPIDADHTLLHFALDGSATGTRRPLAHLAFTALPADHSALVPIDLDNLTGFAGTRPLAQTTTSGGYVIVISHEPVLVATADSPPTLTVFGIPGTLYLIDRTDRLEDPSAPWLPAGSVTLSGTYQTLPLDISAPLRFLRARLP